MAFDKNSNNVMHSGERAIAKSKSVSPSPKRSKSPGSVFGSSSQFKGVGQGVPGDVRK